MHVTVDCDINIIYGTLLYRVHAISTSLKSFLPQFPIPYITFVGGSKTWNI